MSSGRRWRPTLRRRALSGRSRCCPRRAGARACLLRSGRGALRARSRDDLRGLSRPLRRPRLFAAADRDVALLLGDYLYAHGLVRVAATGDVAAVARPRRSDLALRPVPRGRPAGRRRRLGGDRGHLGAGPSRGVRGLPSATAATPASWRHSRWPRQGAMRSSARSRRTAAGGLKSAHARLADRAAPAPPKRARRSCSRCSSSAWSSSS